MNTELLTRVADAIEDGAHTGRPFTMSSVWCDRAGCETAGCIAGWTVATLVPIEDLPRHIAWPGSAVNRAAELLGLADHGEASRLMRPGALGADVGGWDYRRGPGAPGHITRAHAVAALRDLAAGGACDDTLWTRTDPGGDYDGGE